MASYLSRPALRDQRGMTLAEILAAAVIVAIGLVALASAIPLAAYGIQEGNQLSTATFLANARLEQARNAQWTASPAVDNLGVSASPTAAPQSGGTTTFPDESAVAAPYTADSRQVRITDCGTGAGCTGVVASDLRQVTVTVGFQPLSGVGRGGTKQITVSSLVARR
jgi:prepilin-type N-terminal cleavage/methylation domain-containing protein